MLSSQNTLTQMLKEMRQWCVTIQAEMKETYICNQTTE